VRDYIDIHSIIDNILPLGALCWAASGKDPGFTPGMILELLRRRGKCRPEEVGRLNLASPVDLTELKTRWLQYLDEAEHLCEQLNEAYEMTLDLKDYVEFGGAMIASHTPPQFRNKDL